jgi:hypothetical protein
VKELIAGSSWRRDLNYGHRGAAKEVTPGRVKTSLNRTAPIERAHRVVTLVPTIRKPFDVLGEELLSEKSRGDKTAIELFLRSCAEIDGVALRVLIGDRRLR